MTEPFYFVDSGEHKQLHDLFLSFVDDKKFFEKNWTDISSSVKEWETQSGEKFSDYIHRNDFLEKLVKIYPAIFKDVEKNEAITKTIYSEFYSGIGKQNKFKGIDVITQRVEVSENGRVLFTFKRTDGSMFT
jgi:hypothetical protein